MEKPIISVLKKADKTTNKIIMPKMIIKQWGNQYVMKIYANKIELVPVKQCKGE